MFFKREASKEELLVRKILDLLKFARSKWQVHPFTRIYGSKASYLIHNNISVYPDGSINIATENVKTVISLSNKSERALRKAFKEFFLTEALNDI